MSWIIPGTTLSMNREEADKVEATFDAMFLAGGMVLSQIASITGLEPHTVQNWVKRGYLPPPQQKKYNLEQLCRIITINMLKGALTLDQITSLLRYINGQLDDETDDLIDDAALYFMFVRLAANAKDFDRRSEWEEAIRQILEDYREPVEGAKLRIGNVLRIMLAAWVATRMRQEAESMLQQL